MSLGRIPNSECYPSFYESLGIIHHALLPLSKIQLVYLSFDHDFSHTMLSENNISSPVSSQTRSDLSDNNNNLISQVTNHDNIYKCQRSLISKYKLIATLASHCLNQIFNQVSPFYIPYLLLCPITFCLLLTNTLSLLFHTSLKLGF